MSTVIMAACWPIQGISPAQKSVLISIADNANDEGVCWPSVTTISERTCLSERAVRNALRQLEEAGLVLCHQRPGRSTYYTITPASGAPRQEMPPAPDAPHPGTSCRTPRQEVPDTPAPGAPRTVIEPSGNRKENRKRETASFTVDEMLATKPADLSEQTCRDYYAFRKRKGPLNPTIWKTVLEKLAGCHRHGITADRALAEAMTAGWQGFEVSWLLNRLTPGPSRPQTGQGSLLTGLPEHTPDEYESNPDGKF